MEYMDLLPPTAPASFSRARLARPISSNTTTIADSKKQFFAVCIINNMSARRTWNVQELVGNCVDDSATTRRHTYLVFGS